MSYIGLKHRVSIMCRPNIKIKGQCLNNAKKRGYCIVEGSVLKKPENKT